MDKINTIIKICLIFILSIVFFRNSYSQARNSSVPSKEETFEYILHEISDFSSYANDTWPLYELDVKSYNIKDHSIQVVYFNELLKCEYSHNLKLENIKSVYLSDNALYRVNMESKATDKTNMLYITFKSKSNKVNITCQDGNKMEDFKNEISIAINDSNRSLKFEKAILHMIKLFNNNFNPNLFDE